jgi:hypothetical protein
MAVTPMAATSSKTNLFHIWKLPSEELIIKTVPEMSNHIPDDSGLGEWAEVEIEILFNVKFSKI